jgi:hypothetical protein
MAVDTNFNVKVLIDPENFPPTDKTVIWDTSEKGFTLSNELPGGGKKDCIWYTIKQPSYPSTGLPVFEVEGFTGAPASVGKLKFDDQLPDIDPTLNVGVQINDGTSGDNINYLGRGGVSSDTPYNWLFILNNFYHPSSYGIFSSSDIDISPPSPNYVLNIDRTQVNATSSGYPFESGLATPQDVVIANFLPTDGHGALFPRISGSLVTGETLGSQANFLILSASDNYGTNRLDYLMSPEKGTIRLSSGSNFVEYKYREALNYKTSTTQQNSSTPGTIDLGANYVIYFGLIPLDYSGSLTHNDEVCVEVHNRSNGTDTDYYSLTGFSNSLFTSAQDPRTLFTQFNPKYFSGAHLQYAIKSVNPTSGDEVGETGEIWISQNELLTSSPEVVRNFSIRGAVSQGDSMLGIDFPDESTNNRKVNVSRNNIQGISSTDDYKLEIHWTLYRRHTNYMTPITESLDPNQIPPEVK